ncbi:MAG: PEP-CTERM sorting domain-containing protein [Phycisphaerae bacterium]
MRQLLSAFALAATASTLFAGNVGVLLIPDSGTDKIWAFNAFDGSLISNNFIPADGRMVQPINAVDSGRSTILVTDELADSVFEYGYNGSYIGTFAGPSSGIDGPFGLEVAGNSVYVASNVNGKIVRYDSNGANPTDWATGVGTPRDLEFRANDVLVTESGGDDVVRYDFSGALQGPWHNSDGVSGIDFPQQIQLESDGGALVAGFTAPFGIYDYNPDGTQNRYYGGLITSPRGVYRLGDGNILYAGGTQIRKIDAVSGIETGILNQSGASFRFIEYSPLPEPTSLALLVLGGMLIMKRRA